ncbi:MAG: 16S rRNA (uracil(1498)-N(3))-methyltransferase [Candidatus Scalinduaceae bacterium]
MSVNRFYASFHDGSKDVWMDSSETHHMVNVKRLKVGDRVILFNGRGDECDAEIVKTIRNKVKVKISQIKTVSRESNVRIDIAFAIPKGKRSHFLIQKCAELGVHKLIPLHYERSVVKLKTGCSEKIEKWRSIAIEASKQCGRSIVTEISDVMDFRNILKSVEKYDLSLFACRQSVSNNLKNVLQEHQKENNIISFVGPEGGFTSREIEMAKEARCKFVSLGKQILRVETAVIAISAILSYHYSD